MSNKIDLSLVAEALKAHKVPPPDIRAILEDLNAQVAAESDEAPAPRAKTQYVVLSIPATSQAWVFQIPESAGPHTLVDRINSVAHDFNASKRGRMLPVKNVAEAIESIPRKYWKNADGTVVKTKLPVALIDSTNKLSEPPTA